MWVFGMAFVLAGELILTATGSIHASGAWLVFEVPAVGWVMAFLLIVLDR
ncbi:hypothetical protein BH23CHL8_BH23CHL8_27820 [soil metagenome]